MSSSLSPCIKSAIRREAAALGAFRTGFALAEPVDDRAARQYADWLASGANAGMDWMRRHEPLRRDPRLLLSGARTLIVMVFPYRQPDGCHHLHIADYALGCDYHAVLRERLTRLARFIFSRTGAISRACVDTAPLPERYWAVRAGVGFTGLNGQLYVPGAGSGFFTGTLITTLPLAPDEPVDNGCLRCGACLRACPGGALSATGLDARRCLSYLTIEHRGPLPDDVRLGNRIYGCDVCARVCPLNAVAPPAPLPEFAPSSEVMALDRRAILEMTTGQYRRLFSHSAIRRAPLSQLRRNASHH